MNKYLTNFILAIFLIILPVLGFPVSYLKFFILIIGVAMAIISFFIYREERARRGLPRGPKRDTFVENL